MNKSSKNPDKSVSITDSELKEQWRVIQEMSLQLQHLARQKAWKELVSVQEQRENALEIFFRNDISAGLAAGIATDVKTMLETDRKIQEEIQAYQSSLMKESTHLKKLQARSRSYQAMSKLNRF